MGYLVREEKDDFDGFINLFTRKRVNVSDYFTATGDYVWGWGTPACLIDYYCTTQWAGDYCKGIATFESKCPIYMTHYRLRTRIGASVNMPVSWNINGSLDNETWTRIDTKKDRKELLYAGNSSTFKIDNPMTLRYFRISLAGTTGDFNFHLSRIEFFGVMWTKNCSLPTKIIRTNINTCKSKKSYSQFTQYLAFILVT